jgi:hypothetical protein
MPLYFFNYLNSNGVLTQDEVGEDLAGIDEAVAGAIKSAREILSDQIKHPKDYALEAVLITNKDGKELRRINARDVLPEQLK